MTAPDVARLLLLLALILPDRMLREAPVLCAFRRVTGRACPACGLTRSWQAVAHGRFREGFVHHPLGPVAFVAASFLATNDGAATRLAGADRRWLAAVGAAWTTTWLWRFSRSAPR